ncbi:hypothetical protein BDW22DRAFT_562720 [Trametopsis cervina]|nr:hypothetical protein BDW22DRAFT_562720 [Trametopsis cervina]
MCTLRCHGGRGCVWAAGVRTGEDGGGDALEETSVWVCPAVHPTFFLCSSAPSLAHPSLASHDTSPSDSPISPSHTHPPERSWPDPPIPPSHPPPPHSSSPSSSLVCTSILILATRDSKNLETHAPHYNTTDHTHPGAALGGAHTHRDLSPSIPRNCSFFPLGPEHNTYTLRTPSPSRLSFPSTSPPPPAPPSQHHPRLHRQAHTLRCARTNPDVRFTIRTTRHTRYLSSLLLPPAPRAHPPSSVRPPFPTSHLPSHPISSSPHHPHISLFLSPLPIPSLLTISH